MDGMTDETSHKPKSKSKHRACDSTATNMTEQTEFATFIESASGLQPKKRPPALDLTDARKLGQLAVRRKGTQVYHDPLPTTPGEGQWAYDIMNSNADTSSSVYSNDSPKLAVSPLRAGKRFMPTPILRAYNNWKESNTPHRQPVDPKDIASMEMVIHPGNEHAIMSSSEEAPPINATYASLPVPPTASQDHQAVTKSVTFNDFRKDPDTGKTDTFTPLTPWLMGGVGQRKATKVLFGVHGWLQDTAEANEKRATTHTQAMKPHRFLDSLKKLARDFAEFTDIKPARRTQAPKRLTISLDPREQSLLYCELEFILSNALDTYIKSQLNGGRLDPAKLKKVADAWAAQGRPRVVGFRYDLETQLELIMLHAPSSSSSSTHGSAAAAAAASSDPFVSFSSSASSPRGGGGSGGGQFRFHGTAPRLGEGAVAGVLGTMRADARAMRVRTLCQPDSVVAKHILDARALLQLVGSAEALHVGLAEVSQFFKVVLEREKAVAAEQEKKMAAAAAAGAVAKVEQLE